MTNNLKIEVLVSNIPEDGSIASQFPSQEYVNQQLAKKANLSPEGRLDPSHAPDYTEIPGLYEYIEDTKDEIGLSIASSLQDAKGYTNQQLSTGLQTKADLVNGKIPFDQIPFSADIEDQIQINVENITAVVDQKVAQVVEQVNQAATAANAYTDTKVAENKTYVDTTVGNVIEDVTAIVDTKTVSKEFTIPTYLTPEAGVAAGTGVAAGAYFNVRSTDDDAVAVEYQNNGGVPLPSGKSHPSSTYVQNLSEQLEALSDYTAQPFLPIKTYELNERVQLMNGSIVKSTIASNTTNPNLDMTGWIPDSDSAVKVLNPYMFGSGPSAMAALFAAVEDNSVVVIPQGVFEYNTHLNINGKKNFKIFCFGELYDLCKPIGTTGSSDLVPVGISITNCDSFQVYDLVINSAVTTAVNAVLLAEENNRVPHFDVTNCTNYEIMRPKSKGYVGAYVGNLSLGSAHAMRSSFFRFANGVNVKVKGGEITTGSGGGEFFCFSDCKGLEWEDCYHYQKDSPATFWSFGKVIGCDDVTINGHKVQSESTGSLVDLSGTNIVYENITADYPAGKLLDITAEWEESNTATNGVKVRNCTGTWDIGVFTSTSSTYPEMDNVEIENIPFKNSIAGVRSRGFFATHIKNTVLRGCTFENIRDVIDTGDSYIAALDFPKNVTLDDCKITSTLALTNATVALLPYGDLNVENSVIDLNRVNKLLILDRYASLKALSNLQSSITKVTFKNTTIKNCVIDINANVEFVDCTLFNVAFTSTGTGALSKAKITFSGKTTIEFTNTNPTISTGLVFNLSSAGSVKFLKGVKIYGDVRNTEGNSLFPFVKQGVNTLLDGVDIGCQRVSAAGVVSNMVMVDYQNEISLPFTFVFRDSTLSKANIQLFGTYGAAVASPTTYCNIEVIDSDLRLNYKEFFANTVNNRLKLLFKSNLLAIGQLAYLDATTVTFNAYKRSENIEWV